MHNARANISNTRRGALKTGPHEVHVAPVKIIVFPQYSAVVDKPVDAEKIGAKADKLAKDGNFRKAAPLYLKAADALPDSMTTAQRSLRNSWMRRARQCEQWAVVQDRYKECV